MTVCRFIGWKPDTSRRIYDASRQQAAAHNRAVEHLLDQPETPLRKSSKQGAAGLQGLWLDWRAEGSGLDEILQAICRPGVALAKTRVDAWEGKNAEDAAAVLQAGTADENNKKASRTGERRIDPKSLFIRRKLRDRRCANRLVIHEGVRLMDPNHLRVPGVGVVALREPLPADFRATSATLVERTPAARRQNQKLRPEDRGWKIHVQTRVAGGQRVAHRHGLDKLWTQAEAIAGRLPAGMTEAELKHLTKYAGEFLYPAQGARELNAHRVWEQFEAPIGDVVKYAERRVPELVKDTLNLVPGPGTDEGKHALSDSFPTPEKGDNAALPNTTRPGTGTTPHQKQTAAVAGAVHRIRRAHESRTGMTTIESPTPDTVQVAETEAGEISRNG